MIRSIDIPPSWFPRLLEDFRAIDSNVIGGVLHIVLEDGNFEDHHIKFCLDLAKEEQDLLGVALATLLLDMTLEERRKACGHTSPNESESKDG